MSIGFGGSGGLDDQVVRWMFESNGPQVLADTNTAIDAARSQVQALHAQYAAGTITLDRYDAELRKLAGSMDVLARKKQALEGAAGGLDVNVNRLGMGFNQLAQGAEDLQYSVGGAMNNLGQAIALFGGSGGLIAVVTLAGVAINQLIRHWDDVEAMFATEGVKAFTDEIDTLTERIKELESTEGRLAVDTFELDQAKEKLEDLARAKRAFDALMSRQTAEEQAAGKAFAETMVGAPGGQAAITGKVEARLAADLLAQGQPRQIQERIAAGEREIERIRAAEPPGFTPDLEAIREIERQNRDLTEDLRQVRQNVQKQAEAQVTGIFGQAAMGKAPGIERAIAEMERVGIDAGTIGRARMAHPDVVVTPEGERELERNLRDVGQKERRAKLDKDRRDREAKAERDRLNREADQLNRQGALNEQAGNEARQKQQEDADKEAGRRQKHRIDRAVSGFMPQIGDDIGAVVARRTASGESPEDIAAALTPQVEAHLRQYRTPEALSGPAASAIVEKVMAQVDAKLAGIGGEPRAAATQLAEAGIAARQRAAHEAEAARRSRGMGANPRQAAALGEAAARMGEQGLTFDQSMLAAHAQVMQRIGRVEQSTVRLLNELNFTRQRAGMERGTIVNRRSR